MTVALALKCLQVFPFPSILIKDQKTTNIYPCFLLNSDNILVDPRWRQFNNQCHSSFVPGESALKAAPTEIFTFELSRLPCSRLLVNYNGKLNTKNSRLPVEILPWTQMRTWPFWCILDLQAYLDSCSEDVRHLFERECSVMLECRACKSIFRSFVNFFSHKRGFCRSETYDSKNGGSPPSSPKKIVGLRRTNLAKHVFKKVGVSEITGINDDPSASLFVHTLPSHRREVVAIVDSDGTYRICLPALGYDDSDIPSDRVLLLRPQVNPTRYRGMNLRLRLKNDITRPISQEEVECIERLLKFFPDVVEPSVCRCLYTSCSEIPPFGCTQALAYHMSVKHTVRDKKSMTIPCLLCSKKFITLALFYAHVKRKHARVKLEHIAYRKREADDYLSKKKAKRVKGLLQKTTEPVCPVRVRCRSLSPDSSGESGEPCESNEADGNEVEHSSTLQEEKNAKEEELTNGEQTSPVIEITSDTPTSEQPSPKDDEDKGERSSTVCSNVSADEEKPSNTCALRKKRKRKIPARYRDDDFQYYAKENEHSKTPKLHRGSAQHCSSSQSSAKTSPSTSTHSDSMASDVNEVVRRLVSTVSDLLSQENSSAPHSTSVRSKSSRLRRRPDWMDNEDFVIVDDRKVVVSFQYTKWTRSDGAFAVTAASLALEHPARTLLRELRKNVCENKQAIKLAEDIKLVASSLTDRAACFNASRIAVKANAVLERIDCTRGYKCRRENTADPPVLRVYNSTESVSSHPSTKTVENDGNESGKSTPTLSTESHVTAVMTPRLRRSPMNLLDSPGSLSNRRKQNLNALSDVEDNVTILFKNGKPSKVDDLAMVPVYLSSAQKQLFFSSLKQIDPDEPDGKHVCSQCNEVVPNLKEGRRHMVTHIRVMRLRCSLCGAGSFFCTDLRVHLMEGYCEKLYRAPDGVVDPDRLPCMTKEQADSLSELVDPINPGRVMYTSGQIVSAKSRIPYYPDPVIEERILGPGRVLCRSTPTRTKRT
ncbi:hypothetical protein Y032_0017g3205 [Ancylostoma ceylanicum]|uniref:C2H2-type domain-containing protein n=1 Tax=Ancylostoma ceylanicum TaxID=53326 RepID=A0A016V641_9BILA|nr:hypothetical protein Y032_0017g3205 [Ancylostoma ceylanicum]